MSTTKFGYADSVSERGPRGFPGLKGENSTVPGPAGPAGAGFTTYTQTSGTASFSGTFSGSALFRLTLENTLVTMVLNPINGVCGLSDSINSNAFISSTYRPHSQMIFPIFVYNDGGELNTPGTLKVNTNGTIVINRQYDETVGSGPFYPALGFTDNASCGTYQPVCVRWCTTMSP